MIIKEKNNFSSLSWKRTLEKNLHKWINELDVSPSPEELSIEKSPSPDIYSFYSELCALRSEIHLKAKRDHDAIINFKEILTQFDQTLRTLAKEQLKQIKNSQLQKHEDASQRAFRLLVVEMYERFKRVEDRLGNTPSVRFFTSSVKWRSKWRSLKKGFSILREHFQNILNHEGIHQIKCEGLLFDPNSMKAVEFELIDTVPPNTVLEELASGYLYQKRVLKYAEVKVAVAKGDL
jgi:molecular chaperone GrpE (heat shock protein)